MILFLDFDGVMHPTTRDRIPFEHLEALEGILRGHPDVSVVLSTSWREVFGLKEMQQFFSDDIQPRIVGVTPVIPGAQRWQEIRAYLEETRYVGPYIVVDDDASEFPVGWEPLLLCASAIGLDMEKQVKLIERLKQK